MQNKRGMSGIIVTLILIAVALAVVGIVWFVINNVVQIQVAEVENSSSQVFQTCSGAGYYKIAGIDECLGIVKYLGGEKCCDGDVNVLNGLISYWSFDVNASDDYGDNDGTVHNATWNSTGGFNGKGAYEFDGDGDYIEISETDLGTVNTISLFTKILGGSIVLQAKSSNDYIRFAGNTLIIYSYNGATAYFYTSNLFNNFTNIVFVRDGTNLTFYKEGIFIENQTLSSNPPFKIGYIGRSSGLLQPNGTIDEVRIYNRALSLDEITKLYEFN